MNTIYRVGYQNFYMPNNTLIYLFKVYLMALSSSNYMVLNDIIIPKLKRMWKKAVMTYMVNVRFESLTAVNHMTMTFGTHAQKKKYITITDIQKNWM